MKKKIVMMLVVIAICALFIVPIAGAKLTKVYLFERYWRENATPYCWATVQGSIWVGQSFKIGTVGPNINHKLTSIQIIGFKWGNPGMCKILLYHANKVGKPIGAVISQGIFDGNSLVNQGESPFWSVVNVSMASTINHEDADNVTIVEGVTGKL